MEQITPSNKSKKVEFNLESEQNMNNLKAEMKPILTKYQREQIQIEVNIIPENIDFKNNIDQVRIIQNIA